MAKILVIVLGLVIAYWLLKRYRRTLPPGKGGPRRTMDEDMVRCVHCGLHLPRGESVSIGADSFCCTEHERAHRGDA